MKHKGIFDVLV